MGNTICMILSSMIPIASIYTLYFLRSAIIRLAVITVMSFIFSFVVTVIVHGRRVDIFAATTLQLGLEVSNFRASLESYRRNDETQSNQYQLEARL